MLAVYSLRILGGGSTGFRQWHAAQRLQLELPGQAALVRSVLRAPPQRMLTEDAGAGQAGLSAQKAGTIGAYCRELKLNASQAKAFLAAAAPSPDYPVQLIQVQAFTHPGSCAHFC